MSTLTAASIHVRSQPLRQSQRSLRRHAQASRDDAHESERHLSSHHILRKGYRNGHSRIN